MSRIPYTVIGTGSTGNAVLINHNILIDCGVPFKKIAPYLRQIQIIMLTHIHGDHFNAATLRRIAEDRPTVRFAACSWLLTDLINAGIPAKNIDLLQCGKFYDYGAFQVIPVQLIHNVTNCGYKLFFAGGKAFYATDTNNLNGISAKGYDLYLVECNYEDQEIHERIKEKEINGEFAYEKSVIYNHLSKQKCDAWIYSNADELSEYVYLHQHKND